MKDDFSPSNPEEELPPGMRIVEGDEDIDDVDVKKPAGDDLDDGLIEKEEDLTEKEEPPLNLNEEYE